MIIACVFIFLASKKIAPIDSKLKILLWCGILKLSTSNFGTDAFAFGYSCALVTFLRAFDLEKAATLVFPV